MNSRLLFFLSTQFLFVLLCGCTKTSNTTFTPPSQIITDTSSNGIFYFDAVDDAGAHLKKINFHDSITYWSTDIHGVIGAPLNYNSGMLFSGTYGTLSCYNSLTGVNQWINGFPGLNDPNAENYRETNFTDTFVFYTQATSSFKSAQLFCANKFSGEIIWFKKIDYGGWTYNYFNAKPYVINNKVIVLTRNIDGETKITCFNASNGEEAWSTQINNQLVSYLKIDNNKIYSIGGQYIYCYDAFNGALQWQKNIPMISAGINTRLFSFFDESKLIIVNNKLNDFGGNVLISILDKINGNSVKDFILTNPSNSSLSSCVYHNNTLYSIYPVFNSSGYNLKAYNINTMEEKWKYIGYNVKDTTLLGGSQLGPILTDDALIIYSRNLDINESKILFINFMGEPIQQYFYEGSIFHFIYSKGGKVYKLQDY